jgi:hypothetical protein
MVDRIDWKTNRQGNWLAAGTRKRSALSTRKRALKR